LPCSINGLAIIEPLQLNRHVDGLFVYVIELTKVYFWMIFNFTVQLFLIAQIYKVDLAHVDHYCVEHLTGLAFICVFIFESTIFAEIRHTVLIMTWLYNCEPKQQGHTLLSTKEDKGGGAVMVEEKKGKMAAMQKKFRPVPPKDMPQWGFDNITTAYKVFCMVVVVMPKFFIGIWLAYSGGIYIVHSGATEDMVLNTLAVNFIADLDEILYETFTSDATKSSMEHAAGVEIELSNKARFSSWLSNTVVYPAVCIVASFFFVEVVGGCTQPSLSVAIDDMMLLFHAAEAIQ